MCSVATEVSVNQLSPLKTGRKDINVERRFVLTAVLYKYARRF
jgi:hypothetical protein